MRVRLERPGPRREREFLAAVRRSRSLLRPWVAPPSTAASYRAYLRPLRGPGHDGYFAVARSSGALVGVVNLSEIVQDRRALARPRALGVAPRGRVTIVRVTYIGGSTALLELGGLRLLTDPTFDPAGTIYPSGAYTLRKTLGPARPPAALAPVDAVLLSHDHSTPGRRRTCRHRTAACSG